MSYYTLQNIGNAAYCYGVAQKKRQPFPTAFLPDDILVLYSVVKATKHRRLLAADVSGCNSDIVKLLETYSANELADFARGDVVPPILKKDSEKPKPKPDFPVERIGGMNIDWDRTDARYPSPTEIGNVRYWRYVAKQRDANLSARELAMRVATFVTTVANCGSQSILVINNECTHLPYLSGEYYAFVRSFLVSLTQQLANGGCPLPILQAGNEPDLKSKFSYYMDAGTYADFLQTIEGIVHSIHAGYKIITSGFASGNAGYYMAVMESLQPITRTRLAGIAIHPYGAGVDTPSAFGIHGVLRQKIKEAQALTGLPVYITEFGAEYENPAHEAEAMYYLQNFFDISREFRAVACCFFAWVEKQTGNQCGIILGDNVIRPNLLKVFSL